MFRPSAGRQRCFTVAGAMERVAAGPPSLMSDRPISPARSMGHAQVVASWACPGHERGAATVHKYIGLVIEVVLKRRRNINDSDEGWFRLEELALCVGLGDRRAAFEWQAPQRHNSRASAHRHDLVRYFP